MVKIAENFNKNQQDSHIPRHTAKHEWNSSNTNKSTKKQQADSSCIQALNQNTEWKKENKRVYHIPRVGSIANASSGYNSL